MLTKIQQILQILLITGNVNVTTVLQFCPDPDEYFFVDSLHVTTSAHKLIADAIRPLLFDSDQGNSAVTLSSHSLAPI